MMSCRGWWMRASGLNITPELTGAPVAPDRGRGRLRVRLNDLLSGGRLKVELIITMAWWVIPAITTVAAVLLWGHNVRPGGLLEERQDRLLALWPFATVLAVVWVIAVVFIR